MSSASTEDLPCLAAAWIVADGRAKLLFEDNTIVLLSRTGLQYAHISPDGTRTRQLSDFALHRFSRHLCVGLRLRNLHSDVPAYCACLRRQLPPGEAFKLGYAIADLAWPTDAEDAIAGGLVEFWPAGRLSVRSRCDSGRVVLDSHGLRFAVSFPLLLVCDAEHNTYTYTWHTQVFSATQYPPRWRPAVQIALAVAAAREVGFPLRSQRPAATPAAGRAHSPCSPGAHPQPTLLQQASAACVGGPGGPPTLLRPLSAAGASQLPASCGVMPLPAALGGGASAEHATDAVPGDVGDGSWWCEPSLLLPPGDHVLLEWTPEATYICPQGTGEVEVWLHGNDSCMATTQGGAFMQHWMPGETDARVYALGAVPENVTSMATGQRVKVEQVVARGFKLRSAMAAVAVTGGVGAALHARGAAAAAAAAAAAPARAVAAAAVGILPPVAPAPGQRPPAGALSWLDAAPLITQDVLEEHDAAGMGRFVAYADGRVKAAFSDRTILNMDAAGAACRLLLPDARSVVVASLNPVGVEVYVHAALEFRAWALRTPAERAQVLRLQAAVQVELQKSARMAHVCDWAANSKVPTMDLVDAADEASSCPGPSKSTLHDADWSGAMARMGAGRVSISGGGPQGGLQLPSDMQPGTCHGGRGGKMDASGSDGWCPANSSPIHPSMRQHFVEELLSRNAAMLQRL